MQCYTCNLSPICKIFQTANDAKVVADVAITNCKLYQPQSGVQAVNPVPIIQKPAPAPVNHPQIRQRTPEQISQVSERIRQMQKEMKENKEEPSVKAEQDDMRPQVISIKKKCATCGQETKISMSCAGCGTSICDGCAVESVEDGKSYCETCWDDL